MKSPFPGMDPYLESRWSDIRLKLLVYIAEALASQLPVQLRARIHEREAPDSPDELIPGEPEFDRWIQVEDARDDGRVVTVIEILSPETKTLGPRTELYRQHLRRFMGSGANVVEIDLRRGPRDGLVLTGSCLPLHHRQQYMITICRARAQREWEVYPVPLRHELPALRIPLREVDADAVVSLQPLIEQAYRSGGHDDIDYTKPPVPPLSPEDEAWADALLRAAGKR